MQRNQLGKVGLLKKIKLPHGGSYELEYARVGNMRELPQSKYVLSSVTMNSGLQSKSGNVQSYKTEYTYKDGYYDRKEKEFYGFKTVKAVTGTGKTTETEYYIDAYYRKGMVKKETVSAGGNIYSIKEYEVDVVPHARVKKEWNTINSTSDLMTKENSMWNINLKKLTGVKELISALEKYHFIVETIHKDKFWFSHERNGALVIDYARGQENIIRLDYRGYCNRSIGYKKKWAVSEWDDMRRYVCEELAPLIDTFRGPYRLTMEETKEAIIEAMKELGYIDYVEGSENLKISYRYADMKIVFSHFAAPYYVGNNKVCSPEKTISMSAVEEKKYDFIRYTVNGTPIYYCKLKEWEIIYNTVLLETSVRRYRYAWFDFADRTLDGKDCLAAMVKEVVADLPAILQQLHDNEDAFYQYSKWL